MVAAANPGWNGGWRGGNWNGGWHGDRFHHRHFFPGAAFAAGVALGGAYYGPDYYDYGPDYAYSDYGYDNDVAVVPETGVDANYCAQRYRSYDPASGTYLGYDGLRHPCP
jgi:BA14K-like protein